MTCSVVFQLSQLKACHFNLTHMFLRGLKNSISDISSKVNNLVTQFYGDYTRGNNTEGFRNRLNRLELTLNQLTGGNGGTIKEIKERLDDLEQFQELLMEHLGIEYDLVPSKEPTELTIVSKNNSSKNTK